MSDRAAALKVVFGNVLHCFTSLKLFEDISNELFRTACKDLKQKIPSGKFPKKSINSCSVNHKVNTS